MIPPFFKMLEDAIKKLLPFEWQVTRDGSPAGTVTKADCGLNPLAQKTWVKFKFNDAAGHKHVFLGRMLVSQSGARGGNDEIEFDGVAVNKDDIVIALHWGWPTKLSVDYKFTDAAGVPHRYSFSGNVNPFG